jgi:hypothetical protein
MAQLAQAGSTRAGLPSAGVFAGPVAWFISTVGNYALSSWVCAHKQPAVPALAAAMVAVSLYGAFLSWRALASASAAPSDETGAGRPHRFIAAVGIMMSLLFALIIVVQGAAGVIFNGCER